MYFHGYESRACRRFCQQDKGGQQRSRNVVCGSWLSRGGSPTFASNAKERIFALAFLGTLGTRIPDRRASPDHFLRHSREMTRVCSRNLTQRPAFGGDDNAFPTCGLRIKVRRFWWVTLSEHKWVILGERRGIFEMEKKENLGVPARGPAHRERMEKTTAWG